MSANFAKMQEVFLAAVARQRPDDRAAYLDQACAGDDLLRHQVSLLLKAHAEAGSVPGAAAAYESDRTAGFSKAADLSGTVIGPYKLIEQIGEGGMGTVWMAQQTEPVKRVVAVKLIKAGMDSRQIIARFEAERQALALMDHANIARVLDAGTTAAGAPYFVMDLVRGVSITQYCDEHHLTPRQRLELFVPVCQAVQHAHQKGIIHRDLKPSNVLVALYDGKPVPRVIDFGVAKAAGQSLTEKTLVTGFGNIVGTLEYMSPEQAELNQLDIDTRSDIYSLGVLLYELLTGSPPFSRKQLEQAGMLEMLRMIREQEPSKPSTRLSTADGLPNVAANRGTEPAKLARLVRGELDWIVMKALEKDRSRRYETANGFAMDVQRYLADDPVFACPPSTAYRFRKFARRNKSVLAMAALTLFFLLVLGAGVGWVWRDRSHREVEFARERALQQKAIENEVNLALDEAEEWQAQERWTEALSAVNRSQGLLAGSESATLREQVQRHRRDLEMVLRLEEVRMLSSESEDLQHDFVAFDLAFKQTFADYGIDVEKLPPEEAAARIRARSGMVNALVGAMDHWAVEYSLSRGPNAAVALTAVAQAADSDPWRRSVREEIKKQGTETLVKLAAAEEVSRQPPDSLILLALVLRSRGLPDLEIEVLRRAQQQFPADFWINILLARAINEKQRPDSDEAVAFLRAALATRPQSFGAYVNLGNALKKQGKEDDASECYRRAIELAPKSVNAHRGLGIALRAQGRLEEAIACIRRALEIDAENANANLDLALMVDAQGKQKEAFIYYQKAIELDPKNPLAHHNWGIALKNEQRLEEAVDSFRKAIELDPLMTSGHLQLGVVLETQGKLEEAVNSFRKVIELDPLMARGHCNLGIALGKQGKSEQAISSLLKAIEIDPLMASAHFTLGNTLLIQRKPDEAIAYLQKATQLNPEDTRALNSFGVALGAQGKLDEAIRHFQKAIELDPKNARAHCNLGRVVQELGRTDEAIFHFEKAVKLDPQYAHALAHLGTALHSAGKVDQALAYYQKIADLGEVQQNDIAWQLVRYPGMDVRIVEKAVQWAQEISERNPNAFGYWNTLGVARYRSGNWEQAIAALTKAEELQPGKYRAFNGFFLAMSHWQLGAQEKAREWYQQAVEWTDKNQPQDEELRRFRTEAAELLGIDEGAQPK